jgi:ATP-dependent protease Clp ATPase subunit
MYDIPGKDNVEEVIINADVIDNAAAPVIVYSDAKSAKKVH